MLTDSVIRSLVICITHLTNLSSGSDPVFPILTIEVVKSIQVLSLTSPACSTRPFASAIPLSLSVQQRSLLRQASPTFRLRDHNQTQNGACLNDIRIYVYIYPLIGSVLLAFAASVVDIASHFGAQSSGDRPPINASLPSIPNYFPPPQVPQMPQIPQVPSQMGSLAGQLQNSQLGLNVGAHQQQQQQQQQNGPSSHDLLNRDPNHGATHFQVGSPARSIRSP